MLKPEFMLLWLFVLAFGPYVRFGLAEIGIASHYSVPYTPTACFGREARQFLTNGYFAAAGEGIWDNGAACGRLYEVQCISAAAAGHACNPNKTINIKIVDRAQTSVSRPAEEGAVLVLSNIAYAAIADTEVPALNIQYLQLT